ncbi:MAG TPA: amino acid ABC transporter substrate-binding protein [Xanthobacteraceae bacterium]|jgi:branched-chain amino acid transport system substrate-binding protein|nr:amino acid ABC transporter substrate-binding protein [Xanthobacteraceae bacterium]
MSMRSIVRACLAALAFAFAAMPAIAADPIKVGFSMALTGAVAPNGKQLLLALEIWRDDVNAKGGLLGRPVELVYYDDQSNPSNVPGIYTKLLTVDNVDLVLGPYATNMIAAAMPVVMQANKTTIGMLGVNINRQFNYPRYFSMISGGDEGTLAFSKGWFELAAAQAPKPKTVAIVAADAEFGRTTCDGTRENAKTGGFDIVYDKSYPPSTTEYASILRAIQATNPDLIYVCAYPPDTVGFVRAANEIDLKTKMFGGAMVGLFATPIKMQLGPLMNGLVFMESFVPSPKLLGLPGLKELLAKYQAKAPGLKIDPLGYGYIPFGYGAGQVLAQAVEGTKSLDHGKLADYIHSNAFQTVAGDIRFGKDGEWAKSRQFFSQFQNITGNDLSQFRDTSHQVILWPADYKTGEMIYPYDKAKKGM